MAKESLKEKARRSRELRARRKAKGICKYCCSPAGGKTLCTECVVKTQLKMHNISREDYNAQLYKQQNKCACCGNDFSYELPCIDHVHNLPECNHPKEVGCKYC